MDKKYIENQIDGKPRNKLEERRREEKDVYKRSIKERKEIRSIFFCVLYVSYSLVFLSFYNI